MSPVPVGEWVSKATYSMYFFKGEPTGENCSLFAYSRPWNVATSTWNQADSGVTWNSPGGDYKREFMSWTPFAQLNSWESLDVTEIVRDFLANPDSSFGFFLLTGYNNIERRYYSSDYEVDSLRPKLTITTSTAITNKNLKSDAGIRVQVNNTAKRINLTMPFNDSYSVYISNVKGRRIYSSGRMRNNTFTITMDNQPSGMYILKVLVNNKTKFRKFILVD